MMCRLGFLASVLALLVPSLAHAGDAQFMPLDTAVNYHASIALPRSTASCDLMMTMTHAADGLSAKVTAVTSSCGIAAYGLPWDVLIETPAPSASGPASKLRVVGVKGGQFGGHMFRGCCG